MSITSILNWFISARPIPTEQQITTQMGVHFEEVHEMLMEVSGTDPETRLLLEKAKLAMGQLATHIKENEGCVEVPVENRVNFLDSLCDQIVTAVGTAWGYRMKIEQAIDEVDRSNWSKFEDGRVLYDHTGKIMKGRYYFKAQLDKYV